MSHYYTRQTTDVACVCGCECGEVVRTGMRRRGKRVDLEYGHSIYP